jgi:putative endonuclease
MGDARHERGRRGERLAERHLKKLGYRLQARRFGTPVGELDLVMTDGQTVVFVEVKTRADRRLADPEDAVTRAKQRRLARAVGWYLREKRLEDRPCRFDVVTVILPDEGAAEIEHMPDAFVPPR